MESVMDALRWLSFVWVDAAIAVSLVLSAALGYRSGFVWQVIRIVSVVVAFWVAEQFHPLVASRLGTDMGESERLWIGYGGLFVGSLLVAYLASFLLRAPINALKPEGPDRVLGAVLGTVKGLLLCGIIALTVLQFADEGGDLRRSVRWSPFARIVVECVRALWFCMPGK